MISELRPRRDKLVLQNKVAEFARVGVDPYFSLNPLSFNKSEADAKFNEAVRLKLLKSRLGLPIESGNILLTHPIIDDDKVVVKRLTKSGWDRHTTPDEYWQKIQDQHRLTEKYFGRRFVPYTEFVTLDTHLDNSPYLFPEHEYIQVQEKVKGEGYSPFYPLRYEVSPKLKDEMIEFVKRYEQMMREEKVTIANQIMVDYEGGEVKVYDTNGLTDFDVKINGYSRNFLAAYHIDPQSIQTPEDIMQTIVNVLPEAKSLQGADYYTFVAAVGDYKQGGLGDMIRKRLEQLFPDQGQAEYIDVSHGFGQLVNLLHDFAPESYHNRFIEDIMTKFGISDAELVDQQKVFNPSGEE